MLNLQSGISKVIDRGLFYIIYNSETCVFFLLIYVIFCYFLLPIMFHFHVNELTKLQYKCEKKSNTLEV